MSWILPMDPDEYEWVTESKSYGTYPGTDVPFGAVTGGWRRRSDEEIAAIKASRAALAATMPSRAPTDVIASAIASVCSDGNANPNDVAGDVLRALYLSGWNITPMEGEEITYGTR